MMKQQEVQTLETYRSVLYLYPIAQSDLNYRIPFGAIVTAVTAADLGVTSLSDLLSGRRCFSRIDVATAEGDMLSSEVDKVEVSVIPRREVGGLTRSVRLKFDVLNRHSWSEKMLDDLLNVVQDFVLVYDDGASYLLRTSDTGVSCNLTYRDNGASVDLEMVTPNGLLPIV